MFSFRFLLLIFLIVPFVEIYFLIQVGSVIGAPWTIFLVVLTAVLGAWLVRLQGMAALTRVRSNLDQGQLPAMELVEGLFLLVSGALLLTPGFFTDAIGFAFLTPPIRRALANILVQRGVLHSMHGSATSASWSSQRGPGRSTTIEGEYHRVDDSNKS